MSQQHAVTTRIVSERRGAMQEFTWNTAMPITVHMVVNSDGHAVMWIGDSLESFDVTEGAWEIQTIVHS